MFAEVAVECRAAGPAAVLFESLAPWADQVSASGMTAEGPVSHYLGGLASTLGRHDEAESFFAKSTEWCDRAGAVHFGVRTDLWRGRLLAERRGPHDLERARDLLTKTHAASVAAGYGGVERRSAAVLQSL